ncbi:MAG TPA: preprotein translocase subunit SecY, partial [Kofleriaceae bacterium]|nr:preprotein translocase subunit SecY [Kofleriaceae bacterium]
MAGSIANIGKVPELRRRILFTLFILAVYRVGVFITVPGVNRVEMSHVVTRGGSGSFLGMFNMFSGGALQQFSIFTLGIMPYVTSSIVMQLLTVVVPKLDQLNKEGEQGRKRINQLTRYGTILVAAVQSWVAAGYVEKLSANGAEVVSNPGLGFHLLTVLTMTTGTTVIMWLGELITDQGIGNGSSLIIFAGIVAAMPDALTRFLAGGGGASTGGLTVLFMLLLVVATIAAICYFERAHRRIPVQYTKRQVGRKMYSGAQSYLPLKINVSGVIPPIFASSILMFPAQIA